MSYNGITSASYAVFLPDSLYFPRHSKRDQVGNAISDLRNVMTVKLTHLVLKSWLLDCFPDPSYFIVHLTFQENMAIRRVEILLISPGSLKVSAQVSSLHLGLPIKTTFQ